MKTPLKVALLTAFTLYLPLTAEAHRTWLLPSATVLSSENAWVSVDAAVSNDIFHADHSPMRLDSLVITAPDGKTVAPQHALTAQYRSTFDVQLQQKGTYKIAIVADGLLAFWENDAGQHQMWPPGGGKANPADFDKMVPKKAKGLEVAQYARRMETFVTAGTPDNAVFKPTNQGLELIPVTHPNDVIAGGKSEFKFLMDGKPAAAIKVTLIPGGMRYRNDQASIDLETDSNGSVKITWPQAGMYWLNASYSAPKIQKPATVRSGSYSATFEVLPE